MIRLFKSKASAWMFLTIFAIPALLLVALTVEARTWTDAKGRTIEADILRVDGDAAVVKKNGKEVRLPLDMLSEQDKQLT